MEKLIEFSNAAHLRSASSIHSQVDDNYIFCHVGPGDGILPSLIEPVPMKLTGTMLVMMLGGSELTVEVNLESFVMRPGSLLILFPGNVVRTMGDVPADIDAYTLYFDVKFSRSVNINLSSMAIPAPVEKPRPVMALSEAEMRLIEQYFLLIHSSTMEESNQQLQKSIASSLTAALFYQLVQLYHKRLPAEITPESEQRGTARRNEYVREFVRLVHMHYLRERSVSFYADKLFISPKYLSLLVKRATGRSAARWIDEFVLMEAKNMLRFSGKNIQQVAYALNFPTQSSFGKYFKHLTGLSPSEYQRG